MFCSKRAGVLGSTELEALGSEHIKKGVKIVFLHHLLFQHGQEEVGLAGRSHRPFWFVLGFLLHSNVGTFMSDPR